MTEMILKLKIGFTFSFPTKVDKGKVSNNYSNIKIFFSFSKKL